MGDDIQEQFLERIGLRELLSLETDSKAISR